MTTTPSRARHRFYSDPPGVSIYSAPELGEILGRRLLARMHRVARNTDGSGIYNLYIVDKNGMFSKHPVKLTHLECSDLVPDPAVLWPSHEVPETLKRAKFMTHDLPTTEPQITAESEHTKKAKIRVRTRVAGDYGSDQVVQQAVTRFLKRR